MEIARNTSSTTDAADAARRNAVTGSEIVHNVVESIAEVDRKTSTLRASLAHPALARLDQALAAPELQAALDQMMGRATAEA